MFVDVFFGASTQEVKHRGTFANVFGVEHHRSVISSNTIEKGLKSMGLCVKGNAWIHLSSIQAGLVLPRQFAKKCCLRAVKRLRGKVRR